MSVVRRRAVPVFFWQGVMILLPAALLAVAGLYALRQDRLLIEHEAVEQARKLAMELVQHRLAHEWVPLPTWFPNRGEDRPSVTAASEDPILALARSPGNVVGFCVGPSLQLLWPPPSQPLPNPKPVVSTDLTQIQAEAWLHFQQAIWQPAPSLIGVRSALDILLQSQIPDRLAAQAHYQTGVRALQAGDTRSAFDAFELVRTRYAGARGETGLPLKVLSELHLLRLARSATNQPVNIAWIEDILATATQSANPLGDYLVSLMTNTLPTLRELGPTQRDGRWTGVAQWQQVRQAHAQARKLHEAVLYPQMLRGNRLAFVSTNFWLTWQDEPWLVTRWVAEGGTWFLAQSESNLVDRLQQALARQAPPRHLGIGIAMAGQPVLPSPTNGVLLAVYPNLPPGAVQHAGCVVSVTLTDPATLYARQRQRSLWLGALILMAMGAVIAGFMNAWGAFRRQQKLNELKTNFVSSVSHELRAPIASVRLMAEELATDGDHEVGRGRQYHQFMVQECRRLSGLIENVLDFTRMEQGRKQYEFEPTDLRALLEATRQVLALGAAEKSVRLQVRIQGTPVEVEADGQAIQQVLVNLTDNAIKFSPAGSEIILGLDFPPETKGPDAGVKLWVQDQGPGIPPADHERIFERFYRCGSELRRETAGVGLGLAIARGIVEAHRGRISLDSRLGQGSRFTVKLPLGPGMPKPDSGSHLRSHP